MANPENGEIEYGQLNQSSEAIDRGEAMASGVGIALGVVGGLALAFMVNSAEATGVPSVDGEELFAVGAIGLAAGWMGKEIGRRIGMSHQVARLVQLSHLPSQRVRTLISNHYNESETNL